VGLNFARVDLTGSAVLGNNPGVIPLRVAKTLCALAAILGLTGLSVLPPEHVHGGPSDAASHRGHVIHRHFAPHHAGRHHEIADAPSAGQTLQAGDDDEDAQTIPLFFTAGTCSAKYHPASVAVQSGTDLADVPTRASSEASSPSPEPDISPPGLTPSLRAPPVLS